MTFAGWLAKHLGHEEQDVEQLLGDETALHFLMVWSLFESKCFKGFFEIAKIDAFCKRIVDQEAFDACSVSEIASHFHDRYQDAKLYRHLMHGGKSPRMEKILQRTFADLSTQEKVFVTVITVYRYRNNIFHGNKGVNSWLAFRPQISRCIDAMKAFVDHAETQLPSLQIPAEGL